MISTFTEIGRSALRNKARGLLFRQKRLDSVNKQLEDNYWALADPENEQNLSKRTARFNDKIESVDSEIRSLKKDLKKFPENEELLSTIDKFSSTRNTLVRERNKLKLQEADLDRKQVELLQMRDQESNRINKMQREIDSFVSGVQFSPQKMIRRVVLQKGTEEELREAIKENERNMKQVSYMIRELKALNTVYDSDEIKSNLSRLTDFYEKLSDTNDSMDKKLSTLRSAKVKSLIDAAAELSSIRQRVKSPSAIIRQAIDFYSDSRTERIKNDAQKLRDDYDILMKSITKDIKIGDTKRDIERIKALQKKLENIKDSKYWKILVKRPSGYDKLGFVSFQRELEMNEKELQNMLDVLEHQKSKLKARDCDLLRERLKIITKAYSEWKTIKRNIRRVYRESRDFETKQEVALRILTEERDKVDKILEMELTEKNRNAYLRLKERIDWELERLTNQWEKSAQRFENITVTALSEYPESIQNVRTRLVNEKRYITTLLEKYCTGLAIPEVRDYAGKVQNIIDKWGDILDEYNEIYREEKEKIQQVEDKLFALLEERIEKEVKKTNKLMEGINKEITKIDTKFSSILDYLSPENQKKPPKKTTKLLKHLFTVLGEISILEDLQTEQVKKSENLLKYINFILKDAQELSVIYFETLNDTLEAGYTMELRPDRTFGVRRSHSEDRGEYGVTLITPLDYPYKSAHTHPPYEGKFGRFIHSFSFSPDDLYSSAISFREIVADVIVIDEDNTVRLYSLKKRSENIKKEAELIEKILYAGESYIEKKQRFQKLYSLNFSMKQPMSEIEKIKNEYDEAKKEWEILYNEWQKRDIRIGDIASGYKLAIDRLIRNKSTHWENASKEDLVNFSAKITKKYVDQLNLDFYYESSQTIEKMIKSKIEAAINIKEEEVNAFYEIVDLIQENIENYNTIEDLFIDIKTKVKENKETVDKIERNAIILKNEIDRVKKSLYKIRVEMAKQDKEKRWKLRNELYREALDQLNEFDSNLNELDSITKEIESIEIPEE